jgi:glutaconate CoA-transferase subunit A
MADNKCMSVEDAIRAYVRPGSLVFVGGFGQGVPFALGREIIRQEMSGLTLCRTGADILFDLLVAAGAAQEIIVGWFGNPGIGLSHVCRRAQRDGKLTIDETSNFGLLLRLEAAALGIPFMPTRTLEGGDLPLIAAHATVQCPFTGERVGAVPALTPDVALIHAQRADRAGNVQMWGITGDTITGAKAARHVVCSVEEIVDDNVIRNEPGATVLPAFRVDAVVEAPWGAWPSYVHDRYDRDDDYYRAWDKLSRDPDWVADKVAEIRRGGMPADTIDRARLHWRQGEMA